jgi:integrase
MEERGISGQRVTIKKACDDFIQDAKARGLRPPSIYKYDLLFGRLQAFAEQEGREFINELDLETIRRFRATWNHKNFAARNKTENLRALFRFAHGAKWISENPAAALKSPQVTANPTLPFTPDEYAAILKACESYEGPNRAMLKAFILLLRCTGLRIRDAVTLKRSSVVSGKLFLRSAKTGVPVHLPLPPDSLEALAVLPSVGEYYFWSGASKPKVRVGNFQKMLQTVFRKAGISGGHAHRFRDTFAIELLLAGVSLENVAASLGNSVKVVEKHYAPWVAARQNQLEEAVKSTWARRTKSRTLK